jgi:hypothetical protein
MKIVAVEIAAAASGGGALATTAARPLTAAPRCPLTAPPPPRPRFCAAPAYQIG